MIYRIAKWERWDIRQEAEQLNRKYFGRELVFDFPLVYGPLRRLYGKVESTYNRRTNEVVVRKLVMTNAYNLSDDLFHSILAHELIHVLLHQQGVVKDVGRDKSHGPLFRKEIARLATLGLSVPLSEDIPVDLELDPGKMFRSPVNAVIKNRMAIAPYRHATTDDLFLLTKIAGASAKSFNTTWTLELLRSVNPVLRNYPIAQNLITWMRKGRLYKLKPGHYEELKPMVYMIVTAKPDGTVTQQRV